MWVTKALAATRAIAAPAFGSSRVADAGKDRHGTVVRFFWRSNDARLTSHAAWVGRLERKNRVSGTSAPTLATVWSGPLDLLAALETHPDLVDLVIHDAVVEMKSTFDESGGNARNHDLVVHASTPKGEPVAVFVEAKAGEPLGETVAKQRVIAAKAKQKNARSKAEKRLVDLVGGLELGDPRIEDVRYQLLTAWAGTLASADGFEHAVLAVHEFQTDARPRDKTKVNGTALALFTDVVFGLELNPDHSIPWCVRLPDVAGIDAVLYLAHVVTDLTTATLKPAAH
jgi:hypothetical protein